MRPANLLIPNSTYIWQSPEEDLSRAIEHFQLTFEKVSANEDRLFCMPDLLDQTIEDEHFIQILADYELAALIFPWLLQSHQRFLIDILLNYPLEISPRRASSLPDLDKEYEEENNGVMRLGICDFERHVYDEKSWYALHWEYLGKFNQFINWTENEILPSQSFSKFIIFELVQQIDLSFEDEEQAISHFETKLIRSNELSKGEKIQLAERIAKANAYRENRELSSKESILVKSERKIFEITKHGYKQYLSLDFENWQFEVCDHRGKHIGVWNFSGRKTDEADDKGKHDLRCLR